jgi:sulfopyruvate decarboxylase subunit alpha
MLEVIRAVEKDPELKHVPLCREEEGIGICAGAYLAGKKTAIIMQNAGFLNSCNALTTTSLQFQIPILMLIYYAGDIGDRGFTTLGAVTEPVLQAMGFRSYVLRQETRSTPFARRADFGRRRQKAGGGLVNQERPRE